MNYNPALVLIIIILFIIYDISYHIASHHIASHHIISHRITSHHITSHHITSHHIISYHIISHIISYHIISYQYLLLTEFEGRTVNYGPRFSLRFMAKREKQGSIIYSTDRENEVSNIFITSLYLGIERVGRKAVSIQAEWHQMIDAYLYFSLACLLLKAPRNQFQSLEHLLHFFLDFLSLQTF